MSEYTPKLLIEPLHMPEQPGTMLVTDEERLCAAKFGSARRRAEYLMWRSMVRRQLGADVEIGYDPNGAPVLENRNECIGVSHSDDLVAVIISGRRCAVDAERLSRNFAGISSRYVTAEERRLSADSRLEAAIWCAKETLYKYSGRKGLDFLRDILVEKVDFERGIIVGRLCDGGSVTMQMLCRDNNLVVWVG